MKLLMSHYAENTSGYLINNAFSVLSDWGQETAGVSPMVPTEFTETTTYYYLAASMAEMAAELGYDADATAYSDLAANIRRAFNNKFYDAATGVYTSINGGGGRQSEQAMPLYYGLVPEGDGEKVCAVLADRVRQDGYKIKTGEIALKCVFMSLARYGYDDIVWQMANQTEGKRGLHDNTRILGCGCLLQEPLHDGSYRGMVLHPLGRNPEHRDGIQHFAYRSVCAAGFAELRCCHRDDVRTGAFFVES